MALSYVARFAVSAAKLRQYLMRKLRERGWNGEGEPPVESLISRFAEAGYVDDEAYARVKSGSLLRKGFGARRIAQALGEAGIAEDLREQTRPADAALRQSALRFARKRRLGPFGPPLTDRAAREKQIAALIRAGHPLDHARAMVNAPDQDQAELWAGMAEGDES